MCCSARMCMCCLCLVLVVTLIALLFGFHVFTDGFHKLRETLHDCDVAAGGTHCNGRPFLGYGAPLPHH